MFEDTDTTEVKVAVPVFPEAPVIKNSNKLDMDIRYIYVVVEGKLLSILTWNDYAYADRYYPQFINYMN